MLKACFIASADQALCMRAQHLLKWLSPFEQLTVGENEDCVSASVFRAGCSLHKRAFNKLNSFKGFMMENIISQYFVKQALLNVDPIIFEENHLPVKDE